MPISHAQLTEVFSEWDLEVTRSTREDIGDRVADGDALEVLTEVGIPERIGDYILFHDFDAGVETVADRFRRPDSPIREQVGDHILLGSGDGILFLRGDTGEVFVWRDEGQLKIGSSLRQFVEFIYLIQAALNVMEKQAVAEERVNSRRFAEQTLSDFQSIDPAGMLIAEEYWNKAIKEAFASLGF